MSTRKLIEAERARLREPKAPSLPTYETSGNERLPGIAEEWILLPWFVGIIAAGVLLGIAQ